MNKQQLASKIWESANKMRSKIEANEYKDYILGFIFYKFLSDKEVKYLKEHDWRDETLSYVTEENTETVELVRKNVGYFIPYQYLFSTWLNQGQDFEAGEVTDALSSFARLINPTHRRVFEGIFKTLETGLSKLGETSGARTKAIRDLLYLIKDIPMDGKQDYDVLGFIYEYLISNFAANAGKKAGEFYTPHEVSLLMSEIVAHHLKDRTEIKIYDPTSGSGSLLINIGKCVARYMGSEDKIKYYAQELKENTYNLTRMNLVMRGILPDNIVTRNGDTLEEDWPFFDDADPVVTYDPLYVDAVVSNPPYSQAWNPVGKDSDPRYARFGLAPKGKADYAFLLHDLYHLTPDGIMTIVLPHGVLFRGGEEGTIRKNLIEQNHIDAIIGLPANIFFGTGIPTIIMVLRQRRPNTDVLIIDASKGFAKEGKNNKLRARDIKKIVDVVIARKDVEKFAKVVSREEIRRNDYNLNIPRYVDSSEPAESWDLYASMFGGIPETELTEMKAHWTAFPGLKEALLHSENGAYYAFANGDVKTAVFEHPSVKEFLAGYHTALDTLPQFLRGQLLEQMETLNRNQEESILSEDVFKRLSGIPLVDPYEAYQMLDDVWNHISVDLEIIQTEGFSATKQVDPNMVLKKKDGHDQEVQEGWVGHVLPFSMVQEHYLKAELAAIQAKVTRLSEIASQYEELLDSLSEDDRSKSFTNDAGDAFVWSEVKKVVKAKECEPETLEILKNADDLSSEEKKLKREIKEESAALHMKTKETIETLTDEQVMALLDEKWIAPVVSGLAQLPMQVVNSFVKKLNDLDKKYESTFEDIEKELQETEQSLIALARQLGGNEYDCQGIK
ncbi:type I restriction-modification system subunit M, partial [Sporofaciens musculi]|uniref:type I restriction-modification system subunit M n=1 Tax=Sporofaciens musculi TaxID=2681861 RepID=UPI002570BD4B